MRTKKNKTSEINGSGQQQVMLRHQGPANVFGSLTKTFDELGFPLTSDLAGFRQPRVDIRDTGDAYELEAELPGVSKENVQVFVTDDRIEIRAETEQEEETEGEGYFIREIGRQSFHRTLPLPRDADPDEVDAELADGCLCVTIGKREGERQNRRSVRVR